MREVRHTCALAAGELLLDAAQRATEGKEWVST